MRIEHIKVTEYPEKKPGGMQTGQIMPGVKITHIPSGFYAIATDSRAQHKNKRKAIRLLRSILDDNKIDYS